MSSRSGYIAMSFRSLPKPIREAIESRMERDAFLEMISRPKYGFGVRKAAVHFYERQFESGPSEQLS